MSMKQTTAVRIGLLVVVPILFGSLLVTVNGADAKSRTYEQLRLFREVMEIVKKNYVKEVNDRDLVEGAINGMLQSLDPYSSFLNQEQLKELQINAGQEFGGLGIEITLDHSVLTIVSPIEGTPAYRAGIKAGDRIVKIDGEITKNISLMDAVKKLRGKPGTKVTLTVMRAGFTKFRDFEISRAVIEVPSLKEQVLEPGYPYIRIVRFQDSTTADLSAAIEKLGGNKKIKGLMLDLRNNPGGLLDQAVKVSDLFIDKGLIVYTDGRVEEQRMNFRATSNKKKEYGFRIAVLINAGSASASEIVAGALQDHDRALLFGTKSFGKASVQTIIPLEKSEGLRLTTAYYFTPDGRNIQKEGIEPDVSLKEEIEKLEEKKRLEELKSGEKPAPDWKEPPKADPEKDPVVGRALKWLKSDVTVEKYKLEHKKDDTADTALIFDSKPK